MNSAEFAEAVRVLGTAFFWGGFLGAVWAVFVGGLLRDFFFMFLRRRSASWRRFDRAMSKLFASGAEQ